MLTKRREVKFRSFIKRLIYAIDFNYIIHDLYIGHRTGNGALYDIYIYRSSASNVLCSSTLLKLTYSTTFLVGGPSVAFGMATHIILTMLLSVFFINVMQTFLNQFFDFHPGIDLRH